MPGIPTGTVTFIFTDIEGSTNLWEHQPEQMQHDFAHQEKLLRETFGAYGGHVYKMIGDAFQVAFATAPIALTAAIEAQRRLQAAAWDGAPMRVRMALHTGVTEERYDDYVGPVLNRVARLLSTGHGGQVLLTQACFELVRDELPKGARLIDHGEHRLKDLIRPEHIYQVSAPGLLEQFPPLKTLDSYPHNLPIQLTSFVGREKEIAEVKQLLRGSPGANRLVTLTGPGGTGKTRMSLHVAADLLETFPDGIWFVELAALSDGRLIPQTISGLLGVREGPGGPTLNALVEALKAKCLLLILDNCEHLVDACAQVANTLLRGCPRLQILASSRELLGIEGEVSYRVPSLSIPDTHRMPPVEVLAQFEAVRLFCERARLVAPGFRITPTNAQALAEICYRLDGIPLAIELVAARVAMMSIEQIAVRLNKSFHLLTGGSRTAMPRHQTLRALIDWSYDMLSRAEQTLLQRLAVFASGWSLETAEAVCADSPNAPHGPEPIEAFDILDLLAQLVNKSLVQVEQRSNRTARYRLLETIRQYALEKLVECGGEKEARHQHMHYFLSLADRTEEEIRGSNQAAWIEQFEEEHDNLRAALEWSPNDDIEAGLRAAAGLLWYHHTRDYGMEGLNMLEHLLAAESGLRGSTPISTSRAAARARALNAAGFMKGSYLEDARGGIAFLEESLALLSAAGQDHGNEAAGAYLNLGRYACFATHYQQARQFFEHSLSTYQGTGSRFGIAESLNELGILEAALGNWQKAINRLEECLSLRKSIGDQDGIGFTLASLGEFVALRGEYQRAEDLLAESVCYFHRSHNDVFAFLTLNFLSFVTWMKGDRPGSLQHYERIPALELLTNEPRTDISQLCWSGDFALCQGEYTQAFQIYTESLAVSKKINSPFFLAHSLIGLGRTAWAQGDLAGAKEWLREALAMVHPLQNKGVLAVIYCAQGRAALSQGNDREALTLARQALPLFQMPFWHWGAGLAFEVLTIHAARQGHARRAARLSGVREEISYATRPYRSPAERELYEAALSAARDRLGEAAFNELQQAGRQMNLEQASTLAMEDGE